MIFLIDRIQKINDNKYLITEFFNVNSISEIVNKKENEVSIKWKDINCLLEEIDKKKLNFLRKINVDVDIIIYVKADRKKLIRIKKRYNKYTIDILSFEEYSRYFRQVNGSNNEHSKKLGSAKEDNGDSYINNIIKELNDLDEYDDDSGLKLTKELLSGDPTKGFDLDLFQYIDSTNEYIFFEFLKRENKYVSNITAHPMRYCWTGGKYDNKKKFISLWEVKTYFGGRLFLVNYSDNRNEKISISEILSLDVDKGIREEKKYIMDYNKFIEWLKIMNTYNDNDKDYLRQFKFKKYDGKFFDNWNSNKNKYGKDK